MSAQIPPIGPHPSVDVLLVGAALWESDHLALVSLAFVRDDDIENPALAQILATVRSMVYAHQAHSPQLVLAELKRAGSLTPAVAEQLKAATTSGADPPAAVRQYAIASVADSLRRRTAAAGAALSAIAEGAEADIAPMVERAATSVRDCADRLATCGGVKMGSELFSDPVFRGTAVEPDWPADDPGPSQPPPEEHGPPALAELLLSRSALTTLPDPEPPLIDDVLDRGTVALLYGMWGTGKSFIALDWAASVATARPWQARMTEACRVLYVAAEGAFGLKARLQAWESGWQRTIPDGTFDVLPRPVNLTHYGDMNGLAALVEWNGYGLVVIDTLARCMVGADENSARDCGVVVDALTRLREQTPGGRGVVLGGVHHSGKDGRTFRGSSAFEAGADTVYSVSRDARTAPSSSAGRSEKKMALNRTFTR